MEIAVLIPAYQPDSVLISLVQALHRENFRLIVTDDGSGPAYADIFSALLPYAEVLTCPENRGKGHALKCALRHLAAGDADTLPLHLRVERQPCRDAVAPAVADVDRACRPPHDLFGGLRQAAERVDIVRIDGHDVAVGMRVEIRDRQALHMAEELFDSRVASDMTLGEAVVRGILPAPKYVTTVYQYQKTLAKYQARVDNLRAPGIQDVNQKYLDALRRALEQADGLDLVFQHHITQTSGKYIVFCANKEHMDEMISHVPEWFSGVNPDVVVYEAYSDDPNTDKAFADFKTDTSDRLKLLFCIDMLNEGVHVEGISGVILFRPTISPIIYKQQIGRALTAGDNTTPLILDVVNNFEGLTSISGLQGEMQEAVHRLYANGEGDRIVTERFEVIEQVHDCRVLFEQLQASLSSGWEHYFSEASIYYAEHGNLNVPKLYTTPGGLSLGVWLVTQRRVREGQIQGNLTEQQIARLDSIGMVWGNRKEIAWQHGFEVAKKYHDTYGNLMVPGKYTDPDGYPLGQWIIKTRQQKLNGRLKEERIAQLDEIGMVWNIFDAKWEKAYALAAAYYEENGNLNIPRSYVTAAGERLGQWVASQQWAYPKGKLTDEQVERLNRIGMYWGNRNDRQWNEGYQEAKRYFDAYGNLNVPAEYVSPNGYNLGNWVKRQRYTRQNPEKSCAVLTEERIAKLDAIGMRWGNRKRAVGAPEQNELIFTRPDKAG